MKICQYRECQQELAKTAKKYCNAKCMGAEVRAARIEDWYVGKFSGTTKTGLSSTIRNHLLELCNNTCPKCGWNKVNPQTGKVPLEVNHIDGDYKNNSPENVEILCPNCHSLTENYKALNTSGRAHRKDYPQYFLKTSPEERQKKKEEVAAKKICACGSEKWFQSKTCWNCRTIKRNRKVQKNYPPLPELVDMIEKHGYVGTGRIIGMSDNAVRKHLRRNGFTELPRKKKL